LRTLDRVPEAIEQVEVWRDLTEKKAVEPWQFLAELLAVQGRVSEAIECLTEGMSYVPEPLALLMSRIRMYANGLYSSRLAPDLAELARGIPESDTPARTAAAARLFSIAATYFDRAKPDQANQILREAHALREKSEVLQFPVSLSFELSELPSSTQEWLEQESKEVHIFRVAKATGTEISALDWIALIVLATLRDRRARAWTGAAR
jgi:tetratricopeptide (TPR) repeat protein